jgi:N-glycosylase/DNA lyase
LQILNENKNIILKNQECFNIALSLDCGQAFRWRKNEDDIWSGVVKNKYLKLKQIKNNEIIFYDTTEEEFNLIWKEYFDLDRDYNLILKNYNEPNLVTACEKYNGIRILKQDEWEAICSFIISQNNNIPRIKGIIERLCENFGERTGESYTFPSADVLADKTLDDLSVLRAGFRAKYILDAAKKISTKEVDIEKIKTLNFEAAKTELLKIKGVGEKVAQCSLLYGFGRIEAFPQDVWVKRIVSELYPDGLPECIKGTEGIAQQYLFHWRRNLDE